MQCAEVVQAHRAAGAGHPPLKTKLSLICIEHRAVLRPEFFGRVFWASFLGEFFGPYWAIYAAT